METTVMGYIGNILVPFIPRIACKETPICENPEIPLGMKMRATGVGPDLLRVHIGHFCGFCGSLLEGRLCFGVYEEGLHVELFSAIATSGTSAATARIKKENHRPQQIAMRVALHYCYWLPLTLVEPQH